jgi:phosphatidylserine/phosphatidylglycerophosphate/cardiolipin synthase-like enzyme
VAPTLASSSDVVAGIAGAHEIAFGSYLVPRAMRDALIAAARRGAHVAVTIEASPYKDPTGGLARFNAATAHALREAGADVRLFSRDQVAFHLKAAVCDGVAYLDDRNWPTRGDTIVRDDDPRDVEVVRAALDGHGGTDDAPATRKDLALQREAELIDAARGAPVVVATESFGGGTISAALRRHAANGDPTTLIVAPHEANRTVLAGLARAGVTVKFGIADEKFALAGDAVWLGSANATYAGGEFGEQTDWGLVSRDPALIAEIGARLAAYGIADIAGCGASPSCR